MPGSQDRRQGAHVSARAAGRLQLVGREGATSRRRAISVLYVEDDEDDVFLLGRQLQALQSFEVEFSHAPTVAAAREMISGSRFDVVLIDFWLGSETAIPLIDAVKLDFVPCPVVLVSSLENDDIELIGRRAGAAGFVAKADLSAAALDRIFVTLLPNEDQEAPAVGGAAAWLRALMRSIDVVQATSGRCARSGEDGALAEAVVVDILGSEDLRQDLMETLAGLEQATRHGAWPTARFDAVPYVADAVERMRLRHGAAVGFLQPAMPIMVETSPALFGDMVQGMFAETSDAAGPTAGVTLAVADGVLSIELSIEGGPAPAGGGGRDPAVAAAEARRFLVETLAHAVGGDFTRVPGPGGGVVSRLSVPLRPAA